MFKRTINGLRSRVLGERHVNAYYNFKAAHARDEILFEPALPAHPSYLIRKVCAELGLRPVIASASPVLAMLYEDGTHTSARPNLLNGQCTDISKRNVERIFLASFGYPLGVDPTVHVGKAVRKSDENATHDGRIIDCPIPEPDSNLVYEVLIDNTIDGDRVEDIRIVVAGNHIPLAYLKRRRKSERFLNTNTEVKIVATDSVLSADEQANCIRMARAIGLDFGEFDTLRDRATGKLYVVDVAKTAFGPPARLNFLAKRYAVKRIAKAFREEFLTKPSAVYRQQNFARP